MHRPPRYRRKSWRRKPPPESVAWSRKDRFLLVVATIVLPLSLLAILHVGSTHRFRNSLEESLNQMRVKYSLTDTQIAEIRQIEIAFHGTGSPFLRPSHTFEEQRTHEIAISQMMTPENAARFLASQKERPGKSHIHSDH